MEEIKVGDIVKCEVSGITDYGVFAKLENGFDGLIHISEISEKYVSNLERLFIRGDIIEVKVLDIDYERRQVKLSIKENKQKSKRKKALEEKGEGFKPLKDKLDYWVQEKLKELEKNAKTP